MFEESTDPWMERENLEFNWASGGEDDDAVDKWGQRGGNF